MSAHSDMTRAMADAINSRRPYSAVMFHACHTYRRGPRGGW